MTEDRRSALATLVATERFRARRRPSRRAARRDARRARSGGTSSTRGTARPCRESSSGRRASRRSADVAVNEAYDGAGATYDLYFEVYGRNSIDDRGMRLDSSVHYGTHYDNAFWNGRQMVYGDGDGKLFERFTISVDVIGHELTHGVTAREANLDYQGQSGALNESISDVFGSLVKQRALGQTAGAGGLADRRGALHAGRAGRRAALDEGAGHRVRRSRPRQGSAARAHARLRRDERRRRRRAHQLGHPEPRVLPRRRRRSAATRGRRPGRSGTSRSATSCAAPPSFADAARLTAQAAGTLFGRDTGRRRGRCATHGSPSA